MTEPARQDEWRVEQNLEDCCYEIYNNVSAVIGKILNQRIAEQIVREHNAMIKVREVVKKLNEDIHCPYCYNKTDDGHESSCPLLALLDELKGQ